MSAARPRGMAAFSLVWLGQIVSLLGSSMTRFALTLWAWETTGRATALASVAFFSFLPELLFSPFAGALIDRWSRKLVMALSDLAAGLATAVVLILHLTGVLSIWHLYVAAVITGVGSSFQWPAYTAAITTLVPVEHRGRANGMMILVDSLPTIVAPVAAGLVYTLAGLSAVLAVDLATFGAALGALAVVTIPNPRRASGDTAARRGLVGEVLEGLRYLVRDRGLRSLQLVFVWGVAITSFGQALLAPMILARTGDDSVVLAAVVSSLALGEVAGGLVMTAWGGPRRRIAGVIVGWAGLCLFGYAVVGLGRGPAIWIPAAFLGTLLSALIGSNQAIWQTKVPETIQGRVFGIRRMTELALAPPAVLLAGVLADRVLEPGMAPGGKLAAVLGPLAGTGPGAGMALLLVAAGLLGALGVAAAGLSRALRDVDR